MSYRGVLWVGSETQSGFLSPTGFCQPGCTQELQHSEVYWFLSLIQVAWLEISGNISGWLFLLVPVVVGVSHGSGCTLSVIEGVEVSEQCSSEVLCWLGVWWRGLAGSSLESVSEV